MNRPTDSVALASGHAMPKVLTYIGLGTSALIGLLFLLDLALKVPFGRASTTMDLAFLICAAILAYLSWSVLKEQA